MHKAEPRVRCWSLIVHLVFHMPLTTLPGVFSMRNQGTENPSNLPKVTELVSGRARGQIQGLYSPELKVPNYEGNHQ